MRSTLLCLLALLLAAVFLFSVTDGNLSVHGDDALIFGRASNYRAQNTYLFHVAARVFLTPVYIAIWDMVGRDPWRMHILYLCLHVLNMMLCFLVLQKIFGIRPALVGALFYLVYAGPYESVTWISAGGYLIVMAVFFTSVLIALSDWNAWVKGSVIALMNWLAIHLYEVLIVAAPLYPLLTAAVWWFGRGRPGGRPRTGRSAPLQLLPTMLPLAVMLMHWWFMYLGRVSFAGRAIWIRNPATRTDPFSLLKALGHTAQLGFSTCCGSRHWDFLSQQIEGILSWHPFGVAYYALFLIAIGALVWVWIKNPSSRRNDLAFPAAGYLILLSPLVAFTIVETVFPSRLLVLCAAGLALFAAALIARWPNPLVIGLVLTAGVAEGLGMQSILVQEQTSNEVDSNIRGQLQAFHLSPHLGDRFFFSLPDFPERAKLWRTSFSRFESGGEGIFLIFEYGFLRMDNVPMDGRLSMLTSQTRGDGTPELNVPVPSSGEAQLYPFLLTDKGVLMGISPLEVTVGERVLRSYENPQFSSLPQGRCVPGQAEAAWYKDGELRLNYYAPDLQLEIHGVVRQAPPGAKLDVKDGGMTVASLPIAATGDFTGRVPLALVRAGSVITLDAAPGLDWEFRSTNFAVR